jgi:hypothetical protein
MALDRGGALCGVDEVRRHPLTAIRTGNEGKTCGTEEIPESLWSVEVLHDMLAERLEPTKPVSPSHGDSLFHGISECETAVTNSKAPRGSVVAYRRIKGGLDTLGDKRKHRSTCQKRQPFASFHGSPPNS